MNRQPYQWRRVLALLCLGMLLLGGCAAPGQSGVSLTAPEAAAPDVLHTLTPVALEGRALRVVATTTIVGDVVAQVGGEQIELLTLLSPGADPHAYQLTPADRQQLEEADVILINGLGLEEGMMSVLEELSARVPIVLVNAGIETIEFGERGEGDHDHAAREGDAHGGEEHVADEHVDSTEHHPHHDVDPHSWQSVPNVMVWTDNIATALSAHDPMHADNYAAAANAYRAELAALDHELHTMVDALPRETRKIVTDHDSLRYLAHHYGFTIIGTVIPGFSTLTAASAQELAAIETQIRDEGVRAIFAGTTVDPGLAGQLAADLGIQVVPIYTDSLSAVDGPAATYIDFMRHNMQTIVNALAE